MIGEKTLRANSAVRPFYLMEITEALAIRLRAYLALSKPTIQLLVILTGASALVLEGSLGRQPARFALLLFALALAAGAAKALNQYLERDVDAQMERTRYSRPLPLGWIAPTEALIFALAMGVASVFLFLLAYNLLSAALAAGTILFYSLFYTVYLKPRTYLSIVIGGLAGGMGPVIAWAAAANTLSYQPFCMLLLIFFWTPAHFWALAYRYREDYRRVGYPLLPALVPEKKFWRQVAVYAALTVLTSFCLLVLKLRWVYLSGALVLGVILLGMVWRAMKAGTEPKALALFRFSMVYLLALFVLMIADLLFIGVN